MAGMLKWVIISAVLRNVSSVGDRACGQHEYLTDQNKCCPMCRPELGLKVKRACSPTSDTLCEPLEGHWCTDPIKDGCLRAVEHTKCSLGQYIKQKGTAYSDTVCGNCATGTYSDGSLTSCKQSSYKCRLIGEGLKTMSYFAFLLISMLLYRHAVWVLYLLLFIMLVVVICVICCQYECDPHDPYNTTSVAFLVFWFCVIMLYVMLMHAVLRG